MSSWYYHISRLGCIIHFYHIRTTVCTRSLDPLYIVSHNMNWAKTSWTYSIVGNHYPYSSSRRPLWSYFPTVEILVFPWIQTERGNSFHSSIEHLSAIVSHGCKIVALPLFVILMQYFLLLQMTSEIHYENAQNVKIY